MGVGARSPGECLVLRQPARPGTGLLQCFRETLNRFLQLHVIELGKLDRQREGLAEGRTEGRAELLSRQLTLKFGELSAEIQQRLQQAGEAELDIWAERVLFAESIDEVFR